MQDNVNFCSNCGTNVIPYQSEGSPYAAAQQSAAAAQAAPKAAPQQEKQQSGFEWGYQQGYDWATGTSSDSAWAGQTAQQVPPASPYGQAMGATKNHIAAGLLAIFLGVFGVHKFYMGYTKQGVIMLLVTLLTFGLGGFVTEIIGIIEGIIYLVKGDEEFYYTYELGNRPWF